MSLPPLPGDFRRPDQDDFDFGETRRRAQVYMRELLSRAEGTGSLRSLKRDQQIALTAAGAAILAPALMSMRRKRRRKKRAAEDA